MGTIQKPRVDVTLADLGTEDGAPVVLTCHRMSLVRVVEETQSLPGGAAAVVEGDADQDSLSLEDAVRLRELAARVVPLGTSLDGVRPAIGEGCPIALEDMTDADLIRAFGGILRASGYTKARTSFRRDNGGGSGAGVGGGGAGEAAAVAEPAARDQGADTGGAAAGGPDVADGGPPAPAGVDGAGAADHG